MFNRIFDFARKRKAKAQEKQLLRERLTEASLRRGSLAEKLRAIQEAKRESALRQEDQWPRNRSTGVVNKNGPSRQVERLTVDRARWYTMNSSNVDKIRYGEDDHLLQVMFKAKGRRGGSLYQYWDVEAQTFTSFLNTHSPGGYVWYVLRAYGYRYKKLSGGHATASPRADRFGGEPFAVPREIEEIQRRAGRKQVDMPEARVKNGERLWVPTTTDMIPVARGVSPPPGVFRLTR